MRLLHRPKVESPLGPAEAYMSYPRGAKLRHDTQRIAVDYAPTLVGTDSEAVASTEGRNVKRM